MLSCLLQKKEKKKKKRERVFVSSKPSLKVRAHVDSDLCSSLSRQSTYLMTVCCMFHSVVN